MMDSTSPDKTPDTVQPWLLGLNPAQLEAVRHGHGPMLVLSGAGTGKTRVLTARIAHLLGEGVARPWNILAVSFTNKAAFEMKHRVAAMIGEAAEQVWFGTFYAIAARILNRHAELVGLQSNYTILDDDDQLRIIKQVMEPMWLDAESYPPRDILATISRWKDDGLGTEQIMPAPSIALVLEIYRQYQARLLAFNACDFGDLLLHTITLFKTHPDILARYNDRFTHVLVDEYQDTNIAQYLWLRLLVQKSRNLCCVGDDDQSIYGWRGVKVANMLRFKDIYSDATIIRLEQNYRSTGHILACASALVAHNQARLGKTLHTDDTMGEKVRLAGYWSGENEARATANEIENLHRYDSVEYSQIGVLVRTKIQTRAFEEAFIREGIPYRVVGAKFYERLEIRDAIAYLRVIAQPADDLALERIINKPKRGVGDSTVDKIRQFGAEHKMPMLAAAEKMLEGDALKPKAKRSVDAIIKLFKHWQDLAQTANHAELLDIVLAESGYRGFWQAEKTPDAEGRLEKLDDLINNMKDFATLGEFLEHTALVMDGDGDSGEGEITLMTLHAAKGLEFDTVFLPGWEEGLFPSERTLREDGIDGLEEERRLAHVGITRAKRRLYISWASSRFIYGSWQNAIPSRFIAELPDTSIIEENEQGVMGGGRIAPRPRTMSRSTGVGWQVKHMPLVDPSIYSTGDRVFHDKFGNGTIRAIDGDRLTIDFDKAGAKRVVANFVQKTGG